MIALILLGFECVDVKVYNSILHWLDRKGGPFKEISRAISFALVYMLCCERFQFHIQLFRRGENVHQESKTDKTRGVDGGTTFKSAK